MLVVLSTDRCASAGSAMNWCPKPRVTEEISISHLEKILLALCDYDFVRHQQALKIPSSPVRAKTAMN